MLAVLARVPELELDKDDAEKLARGITNVGRHYELQAAQKTIDWTNLAMVAATIYGAKLMLIRHRMREAKAKTDDAGPVVDFNVIRQAGRGGMQ